MDDDEPISAEEERAIRAIISEVSKTDLGDTVGPMRKSVLVRRVSERLGGTDEMRVKIYEVLRHMQEVDHQ